MHTRRGPAAATVRALWRATPVAGTAKQAAIVSMFTIQQHINTQAQATTHYDNSATGQEVVRTGREGAPLDASGLCTSMAHFSVPAPCTWRNCASGFSSPGSTSGNDERSTTCRSPVTCHEHPATIDIAIQQTPYALMKRT